MYSMYFVFSYFICPVFCSIDTNACQYVRIKKILLLLFITYIFSSFFLYNNLFTIAIYKLWHNILLIKRHY